MGPVVVATRGSTGIPEFAGSTWVRLQYVLGLRELGIESYWVDRLDAFDPFAARRSVDYLAQQFQKTAEDFGFENHYCIVYDDGRQHFGLSEQELREVADAAELLISVSESPPSTSPLACIPRRAYIDVDPGFTQIWGAQVDMGFDFHTHFFTVGQNVGRDGFAIETCGIEWHPILPPVALRFWPPLADDRCRAFTTIADWRGSQVANFDGRLYEGKRREFLEVISLPAVSGQEMELALCIGQWDHDDLGLLSRNGWLIVDPYGTAGTPNAYREYIRHSRAEFSVAKHGYVLSNSGWISDRTACYLASGKPALVQSTGFEAHLATGEGLLTFRTFEEAVAGIASINDSYARHCSAARALAERMFDARTVLGTLFDVVGF